MFKKILVSGILFTMFFCCFAAGSQMDKQSKSWWFHFGLGGSFATGGEDGSLGGELSVSYQPKKMVFSLRYIGLEEVVIFGSGDQQHEISALVGLATKPGRFYGSVFTGISLVITDVSGSETSVGLPITLHGSIRFSRAFGLYLETFLNINQKRTYGGIMFGLVIGKGLK